MGYTLKTANGDAFWHSWRALEARFELSAGRLQLNIAKEGQRFSVGALVISEYSNLCERVLIVLYGTFEFFLVVFYRKNTAIYCN